jgi:hypothetical protein
VRVVTGSNPVAPTIFFAISSLAPATRAQPER